VKSIITTSSDMAFIPICYCLQCFSLYLVFWNKKRPAHSASRL